jgi:hypothetical protein
MYTFAPFTMRNTDATAQVLRVAGRSEIEIKSFEECLNLFTNLLVILASVAQRVVGGSWNMAVTRAAPNFGFEIGRLNLPVARCVALPVSAALVAFAVYYYSDKVKFLKRVALGNAVSTCGSSYGRIGCNGCRTTGRTRSRTCCVRVCGIRTTGAFRAFFSGALAVRLCGWRGICRFRRFLIAPKVA